MADIFGFAHPKSYKHKHAVILFDEYPGGLGFSEKAFEFIDEIIKSAGHLVKNCSCKGEGCPACVGDHRINKHLILWALRSFYKEVELPKDIKIDGLTNYINAPTPKIDWNNLEGKLAESVLNRFEKENLFGSRFLKQSSALEIKGSQLILYYADRS